MSVTPRGMSIQEAYREYRLGRFLVNRRYQRKLVWTLDEKRRLIESVLKGYPIPLILLAVRTSDAGSKEFEILDGMQRLNAIFAFIENQYSLDGMFFDVNQLSRAKQLAEQGIFYAQTDSEKLLPPPSCANILDYTLAVTEFPAQDESAVNEVFGRINAYGRQLSAQERRQAGVVSPFASTIRELAAEIRGDVSQETLDLADMPQISIDIGTEEGGLGISAEETFWCKQGVLRRSQLRESEDEQMLADLAISILDRQPFAFSGNNLDTRYDPAEEDSRRLNERLATYGPARLKHEIRATFSILREVIESYDASANALRRVVHPTGGSNPIKTAFYALFMAFFDLCVTQRRTPENAEELMGSVRNLHKKLQISAGQIRSDSRLANIRVTKGVIQDFFVDRVPPAVEEGSGGVIRFENSLRRSKIETAAYEVKQGLLALASRRMQQEGLLDRIVETICGIANIGPRSNGALFIGVADSKADAERVLALDGVQPIRIGERYCVGVERELVHLGIDLDDYKTRIVRYVAASALSEPLKTAVLGSVECLTYRGLSMICLWIPAQSQASSVGDQLFVREGSETIKVEGFEKTKAVMSLFGGT